MNKSKGLYIHIPFCIKKCKYCDFVSYVGKATFFDSYIDNVLIEAEEYKNEQIDTIFIGGGTPSILSCEQLNKLFNGLFKTFNVTDNCEITMEANPSTLDREKLLIIKNCGVNRLSIGVQSFCDDELKAIGRIHNSKTAHNTIELIKELGFNNFNIDIMLGLPYQTTKTLEETLKTTISLKPTHLSCYSLILEENTPLYDEYERGVYQVVSDEYDRKLYSLTKKILKDNGYTQYEISNFSKPGYESKHNLKYWNCDEYIGLGVSAHSYLDGVRFYNTSDIDKYLQKKFRNNEKTILSEDDKISEYIIMRLRLSSGVNEKEFYEKFKIDFYRKYKTILDKFIKLNFVIYENNSYKLSEKGIDVSNSIMCEFV